MTRTIRRRPAALAVALVVAAAAGLLLVGCGTGGAGHAASPASSASSTVVSVPHAHPHAVEPVAGAHGVQRTRATTDPSVGDPTAHAPSLQSVRRELVRLNLCGGATSPGEAAPVVSDTRPGFVADPGTQQAEGELPVLTADLGALGRAVGMTIYGISGYRSPAHSVAVGGYADDPHTRGEAEDIGVGSLLRSSAALISEAELARFGLYRPFDPSDDPANTEVNHVQLIPRGGPLTLAAATAAYDPDPSCS